MSVFVRPEWWWLLIAAATMAAAGLRGRRAGRVRAGEGMPPGPRSWWVEAAAVALLAAALADPRGLDESATGGPTTQVAFAVDVSRSMAVEDCGGESRLDVAESLLRRLAAETAGRPRTLTAFAGGAELVAGLSREGRFGSPRGAAAGVPRGSNLAGGVRAAADTLAVGLPGGRVVVVLSDGESQTPPRPVGGATVLGVCVGREGVVPGGDWSATAAGPLIYEGEVVRSRADADALRAACGEVWTLASMDRVDAVAEEIAGRIAGLDEASARGRSPRRSFRPLLVAAAVLLSAAVVRRRFAAVSVLFLMAVADPSALGHRLADRGAWAEAAAAFGEAAAADPGDAEAQYNRGTALARAVLAGQSADAGADLREAVSRLRRAVELRPDWPAARVNLQLAHRLRRRSGGDPPDNRGDDDPPPERDAPPGEGPPPDPFAGDVPPMSPAEADNLLEAARRADPGPSGGGERQSASTSLLPW